MIYFSYLVSKAQTMWLSMLWISNPHRCARLAKIFKSCHRQKYSDFVSSENSTMSQTWFTKIKTSLKWQRTVSNWYDKIPYLI
jgi:hypothetical protein